MSHLCLKVLQGIKPDRKGSAPAHQCLQGVKVGVVLRLLQCFSLQPPLPSLPTRLLQPIKTRQGGGECFSLCDESLDLSETEFWVCCQASRRPLLPAVEAESEPCQAGECVSVSVTEEEGVTQYLPGERGHAPRWGGVAGRDLHFPGSALLQHSPVGQMKEILFGLKMSDVTICKWLGLPTKGYNWTKKSKDSERANTM